MTRAGAYPPPPPVARLIGGSVPEPTDDPTARPIRELVAAEALAGRERTAALEALEAEARGIPAFGFVLWRCLIWQRRLVRSEEHTSELQSRFDLVCRLLLEKKKKTNRSIEQRTILH